MIIYGWKRYVKMLAVLMLVCQHCAMPSEHVIRRLTTKFTLFFIPLFPIGRKHTMICTACQAESKISRQQAEELAAGAGQPAPHPGRQPMQPPPVQHLPQPQPAYGPPQGQPQFHPGQPPMRPPVPGPQQPYGPQPPFMGQPGYQAQPMPYQGQPQPAAYPPAGYPPRPNNGYPYNR
jgi:hypothetical protein